MTLRTVALTLTLLLALGTGGITAQDKVGTVHFATSSTPAARLARRGRAPACRRAMERPAAHYPEDREASVFYALALNATAPPTDKTSADQLKAAAILEKVFAAEPQLPGVAHYLI